MIASRPFRTTLRARIAVDPAFRGALLAEGVEVLLSGDLDTGKAVLRDYVDATIGFDRLAKATGTPSKSLMRMLGPGGTPTAGKVFTIVGELQRLTGVQLTVRGSD